MVSAAPRLCPQYIAAAVAATGGFVAGLMLGWSSPTQPHIEAGVLGFPTTVEEFSWVSSAMTLGAASACVPMGFVVGAIGRKRTMLVLVVPFTVAWLLVINATHVWMLYGGRYLAGACVGSYCVAAPLYIGEIADKKIRGILGSFFQLLITAGVLAAYGFGTFFPVRIFGYICLAFPLLFTVGYIVIPESPAYLVGANQLERAVKSIKWLRGKNYNVEEELQALQEIHRKMTTERGSLRRTLFRSNTIAALVISIALMFFQQLSGISAIIFYSTQIFADASGDGQWPTIIIGSMQFVATFLSTIIADKTGRRLLLMLSIVSIIVCCLLMGLYLIFKERTPLPSGFEMIPPVTLSIFILMFSLGFGPVPWVIMGEIFPADIKDLGGSITACSNWVFCFLVTKTFVNLNAALTPGGTYFFYAAVTLLGGLFVLFLVPETRGKSLNEIQELLRNSAIVRLLRFHS